MANPPAPTLAWETILRTHGPMAFDTAWRLLGHAADWRSGKAIKAP